jgi:hypothetical protein
MSSRDALSQAIRELKTAKAGLDPRASNIPGIGSIAETLRQILQAPSGSLATQLTSCWDTIRSFRDPARAAFVLKPHTSRGPQRQIFGLQLLTIVAQGQAQRPGRIIPQNLGPGVANLRSVVQQAQQAWRQHIQLHGARTVAQQLIDAIRVVYGLLPRGIALQGRVVLFHGQPIQKPLTAKEALLLDALLKAGNRGVTRQQLIQAGIPQPARIKSRLVQKAEFSVLAQHIHAGQTGGYVLHQP